MSIIDKNGIKKIWMYNSGIEHNWQSSKNGIRKIKNTKEQRILNRQAELLFFVTKEDDSVYVIQESDPEFIRDISEFGISKPETILMKDEDQPLSKILHHDQSHLEQLKHHDSSSEVLYVPYILSSVDEEISKECSLSIYGCNSETIKKINNKAAAKRIVADLGLPFIKGYICADRETLNGSYAKLKEEGFSKFVIKEPYNSAGKGVFFIKDEKQFQSFSKMMRFDQQNNQFEVILEGWIDDKRDINYQIEVSEDGQVELVGITEQIISITAYKGSLYPPKLTEEQRNYYIQCSELIGKKLYEMGFTGIVGVDSIIGNDGTIYPSIEFNARFNQSTFYLPFFRYFDNDFKRILIRSYDIKTQSHLDYRRLKEFLRMEQVLYNTLKKEGIVILNSTCLSSYQDDNGFYASRLYLAVVYDENESDELHFDKLDKLIKNIK